MSTTWDLGIFMQALWTTAFKGRLLYYTPEIHISGGCFFGVHFSPIILLLVPLYRLVPRAETLLIVQSTILGITAIPVYLIAKQKLRSETIAVLIAITYLLYLPLHDLNWFDFHFEIFIPITLLLGYYYHEVGSLKRSLLFFILALMCCEFMPIIVASFGLYFIVRLLLAERRNILRERKIYNTSALLFGVILIVISSLWFALSILLIKCIRSYYGGAMPTGRELGPWSVLIRDPMTAVKSILNREKLLYPVYLMMQLGMLPLISTLDVLFLIGSWVVPAWLSVGFPHYYGGFYSPQLHYGGFVIAQIFIALINGLKTLNLNEDSLKRICILVFSLSLILSATLSPFGLGLLHPSKIRIRDHEHILERIIGLVPSEASILTQNNVFPHVCNRENAYVPPHWPPFHPQVRLYERTLPPHIPKDVEYILVDLSNKWSKAIANYSLNQLLDGEYGILAAVDYVLLLKRNYKGTPIDLNVNRGYLIRIHNSTTKEVILEMPVFDLCYLKNIARKGMYVEIRTYLYAPVNGSYEFTFYTTGTSHFYIGDTYMGHVGVENATSLHGAVLIVPPLSPINLTRGYYEIRIIWYGPFDRILLLWTPPWMDGVEEIPIKYLHLEGLQSTSEL